MATIPTTTINSRSVNARARRGCRVPPSCILGPDQTRETALALPDQPATPAAFRWLLAAPLCVGGHEGFPGPDGHRIAAALAAPQPAVAACPVAARDDGGLARGSATKRAGEGRSKFRHARVLATSSAASVFSVPCAACRGCPWSCSFALEDRQLTPIQAFGVSSAGVAGTGWASVSAV